MRSARPAASFRFRDARRADFDALWRIDQECFDQGIAYTRAELAAYMRLKASFTIVAEDARGIAGFIVAAPSRHTGRIITIDIVPRARRTGLGTELMRAAEERLRAARAEISVLEVAVSNAAAIAFYRRLGYSITATLPRYYHGELDAFQMAKLLIPA